MRYIKFPVWEKIKIVIDKEHYEDSGFSEIHCGINLDYREYIKGEQNVRNTICQKIQECKIESITEFDNSTEVEITMSRLTGKMEEPESDPITDFMYGLVSNMDLKSPNKLQENKNVVA